MIWNWWNIYIHIYILLSFLSSFGYLRIFYNRKIWWKVSSRNVLELIQKHRIFHEKNYNKCTRNNFLRIFWIVCSIFRKAQLECFIRRSNCALLRIAKYGNICCWYRPNKAFRHVGTLYQTWGKQTLLLVNKI